MHAIVKFVFPILLYFFSIHAKQKMTTTTTTTLNTNDINIINAISTFIYKQILSSITYEEIKIYVENFIFIYTRPESLTHVFISCISFFILMIVICSLFEFTNPQRKININVRNKQIQNEIKSSIPAVFASTSIALAHMKYIYPVRWNGINPPIFPTSFSTFLLESLAWMICFEIFVYVLHRFLHWRSPIDMYMLIHGDHHVFKYPTAFASQAIHPIEAMLFSETSLIATLLFPISITTQYLCGILLLIWSIAAHDSRHILDKGAHYEHHSHPHTNLGFLGIFDVICGTVWWGYRYDEKSGQPDYVSRLQKIHWFFFHTKPIVDVNEQKQE